MKDIPEQAYVYMKDNKCTRVQHKNSDRKKLRYENYSFDKASFSNEKLANRIYNR